jgi:hypothetical protein
MNLTRESDLAARWDLDVEQFRILRRRHGWSHVKLSRQDIRYTDAQIEHIVSRMTVDGRPAKAADSGLTSRSARRAS